MCMMPLWTGERTGAIMRQNQPEGRDQKEFSPMSKNRRIRKVVKSRPTVEGAGVHLRRAIGFGDPKVSDPFLLLDDFRSDQPQD